jgi:hypothetical protein
MITHHALNPLDRIAMAEMRSMVESTKGTVTGVSAWAYQHIVGEVAVRARVSAFVPEYSLGPEHPFPGAVEDALPRRQDAPGVFRVLRQRLRTGAKARESSTSRVTHKHDSSKTMLNQTGKRSLCSDVSLDRFGA